MFVFWTSVCAALSHQVCPMPLTAEVRNRNPRPTKSLYSQVRGTIPSTRCLQPGGHRHLQHGFGGMQEVQKPAKGSTGVGPSDASVGRFRVWDLGFRVQMGSGFSVE